ncbi:MAG: FtsQ-type POTRA domain-containing protein [Thermodesulfobacteriota bacterium]|nr:FtsQ-type POTRA domain-containing protein [Thermodesulfobacteriota bacterium]
MKRTSVLEKQSIKRDRRRDFFLLKRTLGQLGFGMIKVFLFIFILGILSLAFIYGYRLLSVSDYLRLDNIVISGIKEDLRKELIDISGIKEKENYLSIDTSRLKKNIERHPWIKSVTLKKKFPRTLYINAEREEVSAIVILGGRSYFMDKEGFVFKEVERSDCIDSPAVTGLSMDKIKNGKFLKIAASLLNIIRIEDRLLSLRELSEIHIDNYGAITVYFNKLPLKIFVGKDAFKRKINLLKHVMKNLEDNHQLYRITSIDLDYSDRAVVAFNEKVI